MPHIPSLGYSHCEVIHLNHFLFNPNKSIEVQITVSRIDTSDKSYVHDAAVSWVENVNYDRFTACVMAAGFNERNSSAIVTVDWMAYQGAPVGSVAGKVRISQWWTGTTCKAVTFPSVNDNFDSYCEFNLQMQSALRQETFEFHIVFSQREKLDRFKHNSQ